MSKNKNINLPQQLLDELDDKARLIAESIGTSPKDVETFVSGYVNGYYAAIVEVGAVEHGNTAAEMEFLKKFL